MLSRWVPILFGGVCAFSMEAYAQTCIPETPSQTVGTIWVGPSGSTTPSSLWKFTSAGCPWTITTDVPWITFRNATSGLAQPGLNVSMVAVIASNPDAVPRHGTITFTEGAVVLKIIPVVVTSNSCTYTASPTAAHFGMAGGSGTYIVTGSPSDCFSFDPNFAPFGGPIFGSGVSGSFSNGTFYYSVQPNAGAARSSTVTINSNVIFTVTQDAGDGSLQGNCILGAVSRVGSNFPLQCYEIGGTPPYYSWTVTGSIPNGLRFNALGSFTGTPTDAGPFNLTLMSHDSSLPSPQYSTVTVTGNILPPSLSLTCSSNNGPTQPAVFYNIACAPTGGVGPYHWSIKYGSLPAGLAMSDGFAGGTIISGTPTLAGPYYYVLQLADSSSPFALTTTLVFGGMLWDQPPPLSANCAFSPFDKGYEVGKALSFGCSPQGGIPPYSIIVSADPSLGLGSLFSSFTYAGTPASPGDFSVTVQAFDSTAPNPQVSTQTISISVAPALIFTCSQPLGPNLVGQSYSTSCFASGGIPPYIMNGLPAPLPAGLTSTKTGPASFTISGVPSTPASYFYNGLVFDSLNVSQQVIFSGTIGVGTPAPPPLSVACNPGNIVGPEVSVSITPVQCTASGGTPPYAWSIVPANDLPAGLRLSGTSGNAVSISGTPTVSGNLSFNLNLTDSSPNHQSAAWGPLGFIQPPMTMSCTPAVGPVSVGQVYSMLCPLNGGVPPFSWSLAGSLPAGLSFLTRDIPGPFIHGAPISAGPYTYTLTVHDAYSITASQTFSGTIADLGGGCSYSINPGGQAFPAAGGSGLITVSTGTGCRWTVSGAPGWVTFASGTSGSGTGSVNYTVAANNTGAGLSATLGIAGLYFNIEQQAASIPGLGFVGSMPHVAAQENWTTAFTIVNKSVATATARFSLFGDPVNASGNGPLTLPLAFPQQLSQGPLLAASLDRTISANASLIIETAGPQTPPVQIGSAQLAATNSVDGFAIFHHVVTAQEAVIPLEVRNASSYLLAFDNTNGAVLGVALQNISGQAANIPVVIRDDTGTQIGTLGASIPLAGNGHTSFVLSDPVNGFPVTANKRGTIEFDTPAGGQISTLGIRFTPPNNALTTIPPLANVGTNGGSIAHLASGGDGWQTTFVLVNVGSSAAQTTLSFFADNGNPLSLPLSFPQSGNVTTMMTPSVTQNLAAGATLMMQSSGSVNLLTGSAQLSTTGNVGGFVIFRHNDQEAAVALESRNANAYVLAFDNTADLATAIAINSLSTQTVNIPVTVRDDTGTQIASDMISLAANGHYAFTMVVDKYPATAGLRGTIEFGKPANGQIGVLGIRIPAIAHTFTSLPALAK